MHAKNAPLPNALDGDTGEHEALSVDETLSQNT